MTRVGLIHLTPGQLELLSAMVERPDFEVVGVVHADPHSTPYKIAQVFSIPTDTQAEALRNRSLDLVVVPEEPESIRREVAALGLAPEVLTTREAADRYGLAVQLGVGPGPASATGSHSPGTSSSSFGASSSGAGAAGAAAAGSAAAGAAVPGAVPGASSSKVSAGSSGRAHANASAPPSRPKQGWPDLEFMLRDGLDDLLVNAQGLPVRLGRLVESWAELLGAEACAVLIEDPGRLGDLGWIVGGPRTDLASGPDALARTVLDGVPKVYLRHETRDLAPDAGEEVPYHPRRALAAFPLEPVRGALWFLDLRLPSDEVEERLMVLRRTARRLGRLLALEGRAVALDRNRAAAVRMADLAAQMAAASGRQEVVRKFREAVLAELRPDLAVLRLPGADPEILNGMGMPWSGGLDHLLAAEVELARSARARPGTQIQPSTAAGDHLATGLAVPICHGSVTLGTVSVFRIRPAQGRSLDSKQDSWTEEECRLLERLALHAGAGFALASADEAELTGAGGILDRNRLVALMRAEVRRSDRYSVPFLLTVFELEAPAASGELKSELVDALLHRLLPKLRGTDAIGRLGPRRFAVLNPHTDRTGGRVTTRVREVLGDLEVEFPGAGALEVRANQVHFPTDVSTLDDLLTRLGG